MKLTPVIAAAILAYSAGAVPVKQSIVQNSISSAKNQTDRNTTTANGPIPVAVTSDGLLRPDYKSALLSSTTAVTQDHGKVKMNPFQSGGHGPVVLLNGHHYHDKASLPINAEPRFNESFTARKHPSRGVMWKPAEINSYHEGVSIDVKNSIYELRDKLYYLNKRGRLTPDQANQEIDDLSKVIASRLRINFVTNPPPLFDEMLSALQKHFESEIKTPRQGSSANAVLDETQQAEENALLAKLHANYILLGLQEKIVQLAKSRKLTGRLGNISIGQARQMIKKTPNLSDKDSEFCEMQIKTIETAMKTVTKKKLVNFPASAVAALQNPIKSDFKLPGEEEASAEVPADSQASSQPQTPGQTPDDTNKSSENMTTGAYDSTGSSSLAIRSLPVKRDYSGLDMPFRNVSFANDTTAPATVEVQGDFLFWIDYGAPECMKYILDDDLDLEKLDLFETCQANVAPNVSDAPGAPGVGEASVATNSTDKFTAASAALLKQRDITK